MGHQVKNWNDVSCNAHRYFLCNSQTKQERMGYHEREELIAKRTHRHRVVWEASQKKAYRDYLSKQLWSKMNQIHMNAFQKHHNFQDKYKKNLKKHLFQHLYPGVPYMSGISNMNDMHRRRRNLLKNEDDALLSKCIAVSIYEICMDENYVEIKKLKNKMDAMKYDKNQSITNANGLLTYVYEKEYDKENNEKMQCWIYLHSHQLCMELHGNEMVILIKESDIFIEFSFDNDDDWDEIIKHRDMDIGDMLLSSISIEKCRSFYSSKVCMIKRINGDVCNYKMQILTKMQN